MPRAPLGVLKDTLAKGMLALLDIIHFVTHSSALNCTEQEWVPLAGVFLKCLCFRKDLSAISAVLSMTNEEKPFLLFTKLNT